MEDLIREQKGVVWNWKEWDQEQCLTEHLLVREDEGERWYAVDTAGMRDNKFYEANHWREEEDKLN